MGCGKMLKTNRIEAYAIDGTTGTPLGGFGAGAVKFCAHNGTFAAVTQAPADQNDYSTMGSTKLQFYSCRNGHTETVDTMRAQLCDGRYDDDAIWPEHRVNFGMINDIQVRMVAFSPLAPSNVDLMSMPYAFFEFELMNSGPTEAVAACALQVDLESGSAVFVEGKGFTSDKWSVYADSSDPGAVITAGSDTGFFNHGECTNSLVGALNKAVVKVWLAPNETKSVRFVLAWYDNTDPDRSYYLGIYNDSGAIAELGLRSFERLRANADELVAKMRSSNLPDWLKNQTLNTLVNVTNNSMYKRDGRVAFAEGEWTCFGTMDQMWHARQIINQLMPFYAWQELRYWARTQKDNGQIHHDFNSIGPDKSALVGWDDKDHADYRDISKWVDLNCGFIISIFETYRATGDREQLDYFWLYIKRAGQRILDQVGLYGNDDYPYTFDESENSYDAGGDPNPYNASLSAVAYKVMIKLAEEKGESDLIARYKTAYETVVTSFRARYLNDTFPTGRGCESYYAGQWLSLHLKLGEIWSTSETDLVLDKLDQYYHPYYWGLGNLGGTYNEWTPYLLTHYGGLLLNTGRSSQWASMQKDSYNRQYSNRNYVFNHPLDILPAATEPNYASTTISGDKQYISMPGIWRNYYDLVGYYRDRNTKEIWIQPIILDELDHQMLNAMFITPEGYGAVSCTESGSCYQNKKIIFSVEQLIEVSTIHLSDHYGADVTVTINGEAWAFIRSGTGDAKELLVAWNGMIDSGGINIVTSGDPGAVPPLVPEKPATGADGAKHSAIRSAYSYIEAEGADETAGITLVTPVGGTWYVTDCHNFDYIKLDHVMFEEVGSKSFIAKVASTVDGSRIEIVLDSVGGEVIGACPVPNTGGDEAWEVVTCPIIKTTGKHNVILKFYGNTMSSLLNIDKFKFLQDDGRLDRTGWSASTSRNGLNAHTVLDDDPATGWSISYKSEGASIIIDMKTNQTFNKLTFDHRIDDDPAKYDVFVSSDGVDFGNCIVSGIGKPGSTVTEISFPVQKARYVKIFLSDFDFARRLTIMN